MSATQRHLVAAGLAVAALGATLGCNQRAGAANRGTSNDTVAMASPETEWTDAKILNAVVTANATDSALGAFANTLAQSSGVKSFAQSMARDHGSANQLARDLAQQANISLDSMKMDQDNQQLATKMNELRKLEKVSFDKAYMQGEVTMHEAVLKTIDETFIPSAQNAELREYLLKIRPIVASHLERANMLKGELDRGTVPVGTAQR